MWQWNIHEPRLSSVTRKRFVASTGMWILSTTAFAVWIAYGIMLGEWPIIVPNAICFLLAAFILTLKLLPQHKTERVADAVDPRS